MENDKISVYDYAPDIVESPHDLNIFFWECRQKDSRENTLTIFLATTLSRKYSHLNIDSFVEKVALIVG